ncbi:hypothetical protein BASA83_010134 [Batrachochytrium salamandrivorans]|nr:hypothetical protein BASA62_003949 [Batrachochytrium salamandrivorans]KAH9267107.1 hypothetical protein BASA83_010134 [Batrachochytrium salamandrivorans]
MAAPSSPQPPLRTNPLMPYYKEDTKALLHSSTASIAIPHSVPSSVLLLPATSIAHHPSPSTRMVVPAQQQQQQQQLLVIPPLPTQLCHPPLQSQQFKSLHPKLPLQKHMVSVQGIPNPAPYHPIQMAWTRESFTNLLMDYSRASFFKEYVQQYESKRSVTRPIFLFLDGFWKLHEVFSEIRQNPKGQSAGPNPNHAMPQAKHPVITEFNTMPDCKHGSFQDYSVDSQYNRVTVPEWLATQLLRFYATFIVPGAPEDIVCLSLRAREAIATSLLDLGNGRSISGASFNPAALEVLDLLYTVWYPLFLSSIGLPIPETALVRMHSEGGLPIEDTASLDVYSTDSSSDHGLARIASPSPLSGVRTGTPPPSTHHYELMMQARTRTPSSSGSSNNNTSSSTGSHMNTTSTFSGLTKAATTTGKLTGLFSKLVTKKMPKEELVAEIEIRFTRDSLIRLFHHTLLYHDFAHFVQSTHCGESLMFYEAFLKLESRLMASRRQQLTPTVRGMGVHGRGGVSCSNSSDEIGHHSYAYYRNVHHDNGSGMMMYEYAPCLDRFLKLGGSLDDLHKVLPASTVPILLVPLILLFHAMFIAPGSPNEVNLTHSMRRSIAAELCKGNGLEIPITIFDGAIDHVLALLYDNSFKLYLRHRENKEA